MQDAAAGGKVLQMVSNSVAGVTSGTTQNTWFTSPLEGTITPTSTTSKFLIWYNVGVMSSNTSGDGGTSLRLNRTTSGSTTTPASLSTYGGSGNQHAWFYTNNNPTNYAFYMMADLHAVDGESHTLSPITYKLQFASYNTEACAVGSGGYNARTLITILEVEQ
jgi:hypothetical protein